MSKSLEQIQLFKGLNSAQLKLVEGLCEEAEFFNRERIFKDGDAATHLWFVREGRVDLRFDLPSRETSVEQTITTIITNGTLGWSSMVAPHIYRLSAYCVADFVGLSKINRIALRTLMDAHNDIGYVLMSNLSQVIATRFHDMQEEVATYAGHNIMNRW